MILTLPNMLTIGRIAAIPVIIALLFVDGRLAPWIACIIFTIAAITDILDGYLARMMKTESRLGQLLDPIADKLLVGAVLLVLVGTGRVTDPTIIPAVVILFREILVSGLREHLAQVNVSLPVTWLAKWKTFVQMVALGFLIVGNAAPSSIPAQVIGEVGLWAAAVVTLITGWDYLKAALSHVVSDTIPEHGRPPARPPAPPRRAKSPPAAG